MFEARWVEWFYDVTRLEDAWPDGEARDEQEADDDERREHVAQALGPQENPREVAGWIKLVVRAHLYVYRTPVYTRNH